MSYSDHFLSAVRPLTFSNDFSEAAELMLLKFPCWCFTGSSFPACTSQGHLSLLVHHRVFFPCLRITGSSFLACTSQGLLFLLVLHMVFFPYHCFTNFLLLKFCNNTQTKWSPLNDTYQAMTPSLPQATFFSYAPLQKIAMKSCKQDIKKNKTKKKNNY